MRSKLSVLLILVGLALILLGYFPGPLGVPGFFTFIVCPTDLPKGEAYSCLYNYTLDFFAILGGAIMVAVGLVGAVRIAMRSHTTRSPRVVTG